jgi:minor histocompatibility antigen H13
MITANFQLNIAYLALFLFWFLSYYIVIPVPVNLIVTSTAIVFIGSQRSLHLLVSEQDGGPTKEDKEVLSAKDAYKFPIVGSATLFSLYLAFKYFDKDTVNLILSLYFSVIGVLTLTGSLSKFVSQFVTSSSKFGFKKTLPWIGELDCLLTPAELLCLGVSIVFSYFYFKTKHYMMNNIFGISFCIQGIEKISLGSYQVGAILLVGLFFYDIFWVFGTDVMVTVAKSFDGPIKLLFPRVLPTLASKGEFSLLGLGDIVIPGLFVALLLRFDAVRAKVAIKAFGDKHDFSQPYFLSNVVAYAVGLVTTVGVMYFFNAAQPALLYLVPACLGSSLLVAIYRGEFQLLWAYKEEDDEATKIAEAAKKEE